LIHNNPSLALSKVSMDSFGWQSWRKNPHYIASKVSMDTFNKSESRKLCSQKSKVSMDTFG